MVFHSGFKIKREFFTNRGSGLGRSALVKRKLVTGGILSESKREKGILNPEEVRKSGAFWLGRKARKIGRLTNVSHV